MAVMNVCKLQGSIGYSSSLSPSQLSPILSGHKILCQKQQWAAGLSIPITNSSNKISSNMKMRMKGVVVRCKAGTVGESDFQEKVLNSDLPVLLDFVAPWCGPCKLISPIMDWAAQEYEGKLRVFKIDHDSNPQLVANCKVYGLPALILFKDGKEVPGSRREGAITKAKLKAYLDQFLESVATI